MSMHKIPLTQTEEAGLRAHGLDIGTPSQLSDAFRQGIAWGEKAEREACAKVVETESMPLWAESCDTRDVLASAIRMRSDT